MVGFFQCLESLEFEENIAYFGTEHKDLQNGAFSVCISLQLFSFHEEIFAMIFCKSTLSQINDTFNILRVEKHFLKIYAIK